MKSLGSKRRRCPRCRSPRTTLLMHASAAGTLLHYRCNSCGNLWTEPKTQKSSRLTSFQ